MIRMVAALEMPMAPREHVLDSGLMPAGIVSQPQFSASLPIVFILHLMPAPGETLARDRKTLSSDCSRLVVLEPISEPAVCYWNRETSEARNIQAGFRIRSLGEPQPIPVGGPRIVGRGRGFLITMAFFGNFEWPAEFAPYPCSPNASFVPHCIMPIQHNASSL